MSDISGTERFRKRQIIADFFTVLKDSYSVHIVLIMLIIFLFLRKEESTTIGIAITACVLIIAIGSDNIAKLSLGPKGIELDFVKDLTIKNSAFIQTFIFMSMPEDIFFNLEKICTMNFGSFIFNENFHQQLRYLLNNGFIEAIIPLENIPLDGDQLSESVEPTETGIEFVKERQKILRSHSHILSNRLTKKTL